MKLTETTPNLLFVPVIYKAAGNKGRLGLGLPELPENYFSIFTTTIQNNHPR